MPTYRFFRILKISAVPILFSAAALGLVAVHSSLLRKAERAKSRMLQAAATPDSASPDRTLSLKFRDLAAAAERGELSARIEMGRRLAQGLGVKKDEVHAVQYFQGVINEFGDISAHDKRAPHVATAFLYLARFYKDGVADANISANPAYAFSLLHHAASYFGDPASQVALAKLLISGEGVTKNARAAAQWLLSASRKGYAPAQALLGNMLWRGNGIKRVAGDGLGLLAIARRNASADDKDWVSNMFETARAEALPTEILEANAFIVQESSASRFGLTSNILISGEGTEVVTSDRDSGAVDAIPTQPGSQEGLLVRAPTKSWSELQANPATLVPNAYEPEAIREMKDAAISAGMIPLYQPHQPNGFDKHMEGSSPIRYAGVAK